jgi:hypothetical protein
MGAVGAAGALSGGLLGGPGIGYKQDSYATAQLKEADARIFGGQMALRLTAVVPGVMFLGYLLLVLHFRAQGGYRTVDLAGEATHERSD